MTMSLPAYDPRVTAARPDLAASSLRGEVEAERFVDGERYVVEAEVLDVKRSPRGDAPLDTQLLHGETVTVFEDDNGWGWTQADRDGYVGYVAMSGLRRGRTSNTHSVRVNRTFVYPAADMKQPVLAALPLGATLAVESVQGGFAKVRQGYVVARHLAPVDEVVTDYVAVAEQLVNTPYLWGGKSAQGIDCSGLVQLSGLIGGCVMPRDTHMQEHTGIALPIDDKLHGLTRGDLVFWPGHVGIMLDAVVLLHANAFHMLVAREPLSTACERISASNGTSVSSFRRLSSIPKKV